MKIIRNLFVAACCLGMCAAVSPVYASELDEIEQQAQGLVEQAENLDPGSQESIEAFSQTLNNWDTSTDSLSRMATPNSVQMEFAKLQQQLAEQAKKQAQDKINQIQNQQDRQTELADQINQLRQLKDDISDHVGKLTDDFKNRLVSLGVYDASEALLTKNLTQTEVKSIVEKIEEKTVECENELDQTSSQSSQEMVFIQDYMQQYNQYSQSSIAAIRAAQDQAGASTVSGTMLSGSLGMLFTGILIGAFGAVIVVLLVQKARKGKSQA